MEEQRVAQEAIQKIGQLPEAILGVGSGLSEFALSASLGRLMAEYALPDGIQFPSVEELESEDLTASRIDSIIQMVRRAADVVRGLRLSPRVVDYLIYSVCQVAALYWQHRQGVESEERILSALRELAVELRELKEAQPKEQKPVFIVYKASPIRARSAGNSKRVGVLAPGQPVTFADQARNGWWLIEYHDNGVTRKGWIFSAHLLPVTIPTLQPKTMQ